MFTFHGTYNKIVCVRNWHAKEITYKTKWVSKLESD